MEHAGHTLHNTNCILPQEAVSFLLFSFSNISIQFEKRDALNPERGTLDISKAKSILDYSPVYDLSKGLEKYIEWYRASWFAEMNSKQSAESNE
jgi:nucleoside-diphosphate-sugar epimerase